MIVTALGGSVTKSVGRSSWRSTAGKLTVHIMPSANLSEMNAMSTESNRSLVKRYYEEVFNRGDVGLIDQLAIADYDEHSPFPGQPNGIEGLKARTAGLLAAFKPVFILHEVVAEGDTVVVYWTNTGTHSGPFMGIPPTGRTVKISGVDIYRIRDGKMAEHWHVVEQLQMLQQLGVIPSPEGATH